MSYTHDWGARVFLSVGSCAACDSAGICVCHFMSFWMAFGLFQRETKGTSRDKCVLSRSFKRQLCSPSLSSVDILRPCAVASALGCERQVRLQAELWDQGVYPHLVIQGNPLFQWRGGLWRTFLSSPEVVISHSPAYKSSAARGCSKCRVCMASNDRVVCLCVCVFVCVCGCVGVWVCGCVGVCVSA